MIYFIFYNTIIISLFNILLPILRLVLPKLNKRLKDTKRIFDSIKFKKIDGEQTIWFHAASMGEFEQAKPIIEKIKSQFAKIKIVCTFYSPSGYDNQKNYKYADAILYLPNDSLKNVRKFFDKFEPDLSIFIRYDFWYNFLYESKKRNIPCYLVAATKPANKLIKFVPFITSIVKNYYSHFEKIFTVGEIHSEYFSNLKIKSKILTCSDPRFDRINDIVDQNKSVNLLPEQLLANEFILVLGSTWPADEELVIPAIENINKHDFLIRCIFVPHEPTKEHLDGLSRKIDTVLLSEIVLATENNYSSEQMKELIKNKHIIVDSIGKLLKIYSYANAAYIGGGFGAGVHSVTEPAGYSLPLASGPKIKNSHDAIVLSKMGALSIVKNSDQFSDWITTLLNKNLHSGKLAGDYIKSNLGTTDKIIEEIGILL